LLSLFGNIKLNYVSPDILKMPREVMDEVAEKKVPQAGFASLEKVLPETDVLYVTRVQKERFEDPADYEKVKGAYVIEPGIMKAAKKEMIVMHPLPRVTEISMDFDDDPRAAYFRQMEYGLYVRMALLAMVLGKA
jgi:aspartate carbamoyltransferase catalytic subunit